MVNALIFIVMLTIGIAVFMFIADHVWEYGKKIVYNRRYLIVACCVFYALYLTNLQVFIRPYFTPMNRWAMDDGPYHYYYKGTGVFINHHDVVTNRHVVEGCAAIKIRTKDQTYNGNVFAQHEDWDFAAIRTNANRTIFAVLRDHTLAVDEEVVFPDYTRTPGVFQTRTGNVQDRNRIQIPKDAASQNTENVFFSATFRQGNSGSPLYDVYGYLAGINKSFVLRFDPIYLGAPTQIASGITLLTNFLQQHGISYSQPHDSKRDFFGYPDYLDQMAVGILCGQERPATPAQAGVMQ